jgi:putative ubiquitin-RnfH superfamily antitoxin RatB of RatAB toxin-antitoxin module
MPAEHVERFTLAAVLADQEIEALPVVRRLGLGAATVVQHMARISGKQQDVAGLETQGAAAGGIFQHRSARQHRVIGDRARLRRPLIDLPGRAIEAAQVEPAVHRHHLEQPAEPVHVHSSI